MKLLFRKSSRSFACHSTIRCVSYKLKRCNIRESVLLMDIIVHIFHMTYYWLRHQNSCINFIKTCFGSLWPSYRWTVVLWKLPICAHSILVLFSPALVAHVDSWGTWCMLLVNVNANVYNIPNIYTNFRLQSLEIWYYLRWSEYTCPNKPNCREMFFACHRLS